MGFQNCDLCFDKIYCDEIINIFGEKVMAAFLAISVYSYIIPEYFYMMCFSLQKYMN
jgi:hypothetical protein